MKKKKNIVRLIVIICIFSIVYRLNGVKLHKRGDFDFDVQNTFSSENTHEFELYLYLKYLREDISLSEIMMKNSDGKKEKTLKDVVDSFDKYSFFHIPPNVDYVKKCLDNKTPVLIKYVSCGDNDDGEEEYYTLLIKGYNSISRKFLVLNISQFYMYEYGLRFGFPKEKNEEELKGISLFYHSLKKSFEYAKKKEFKIDQDTLKKYLSYYGASIILKKYSPFYEKVSKELEKITKVESFADEELMHLPEKMCAYDIPFGYHYAILLLKSNEVEKLHKHTLSLTRPSDNNLFRILFKK